MKESDVEGLATHHDPKLWRRNRKAAPQALAGALAGQPLSSEITAPGVPIQCTLGEGNIAHRVTGERCADPAESETLCMQGTSILENREIPDGVRRIR